MLDKELQPFLI